MENELNVAHEYAALAETLLHVGVGCNHTSGLFA